MWRRIERMFYAFGIYLYSIMLIGMLIDGSHGGAVLLLVGLIVFLFSLRGEECIKKLKKRR